MTYKIDYWDSDLGKQMQRDATPAEAAEIDARKAAMPTKADYETAVQQMLDTTAQSHNYDNIISACSYAGAPNPFQAESAKFVAWRGNVWQQCYSTLAQVQAGTIPQPTIAALLALLPVYA